MGYPTVRYLPKGKGDPVAGDGRLRLIADLFAAWTPSTADPASRALRARCGALAGTSGTRKSDGTGATRLHKPEIHYGEK